LEDQSLNNPGQLPALYLGLPVIFPSQSYPKTKPNKEKYHNIKEPKTIPVKNMPQNNNKNNSFENNLKSNQNSKENRNKSTKQSNNTKQHQNQNQNHNQNQDEEEDSNSDTSDSSNNNINKNNKIQPQHIIQWNCNGYYNNFPELKILNSQFNPIAICLQETHLKINPKPSLRNFEVYHFPDISTAKHGVAVCVKNNISSEEIILQTTLKAVAVRIFSPRPVTLCSIYIPPRERPTQSEMENLIQQLPKPFILAGDFNARSRMWSNENAVQREKSSRR
jgi:Endonuclease-reverse transcriptase